MSNDDDRFLFDSLPGKKKLTTRKVHIKRLYDIMQLCIHRNDMERATRAWSILARCKEIHWMSMWKTGLLILNKGLTQHTDSSRNLEYLRMMMLRYSEERENILKELTIQLILADRHEEALDELDLLYLPSFPYQDNSSLHTHAGLIRLYLAQPSSKSGSQSTFDTKHLQEAQKHLTRAKLLEPNNVVAQAFLDKVQYFLDNPEAPGQTITESSEDEESMELES